MQSTVSQERRANLLRCALHLEERLATSALFHASPSAFGCVRRGAADPDRFFFDVMRAASIAGDASGFVV
jgi:hypothetical protein